MSDGNVCGWFKHVSFTPQCNFRCERSTKKEKCRNDTLRFREICVFVIIVVMVMGMKQRQTGAARGKVSANEDAQIYLKLM